MASAEQLKALLKSHINRDDRQFYSVAMQVAAHEAKVGHGKLAMELRDMIDAAKAHAVSDEQQHKLVPLARPRGELASLLSVTYPKNRLADMVLDDQATEQLQRIMKEQRIEAIDGNSWISGVIDRLLLHDGSACIVDFKTDHADTPGQLRERHANQLNAYARIVSRITGIPLERITRTIVSTCLKETVPIQ